MSDLPDPPSGWTVWNVDPDGRAVLAYRPDVFNTTDHPPECLPTLYVSQGRRNHRRPGVDRPEAATGDWFVRLYFEPDVSLDETMRYPDRDAAIDAAYALAADFHAGDVDPRDVYQVPRPDYFDALDELTGDDDEAGDAETADT
ncbi:DUF5820 family protein [Halorubellus salinus]|uniref:DUF5820 family protein n=1 Tax=Halorubellus salinus TaxID=755309 RepID=UPI001D075707|nr:DUF5820 family protein [Halorubellus salinus]